MWQTDFLLFTQVVAGRGFALLHTKRDCHLFIFVSNEDTTRVVLVHFVVPMLDRLIY